ncbi:MAG TPA: helix-turn-helix transcriptional regulator, partial [Candidatus Limnocylindrales bacterium]
MADELPATEERKARIAVGSQIRRWRTARERTLAQVASASGVNVGYLSQIENDKASPSLAVLGAIADALDVP